MVVYTVNCLYSEHCRDLELVSSLARAHNNGSPFHSNVFIFAWDLAAVCIIEVPIIAGCLQGES